MSRGTGWRWAATLFWLANGINHFANAKFYEAIVPPPLDRWKSEVNVAAGLVELAGAALVPSERTRPAARWWLLATLAAVYPANIHMAMRPERYPRFPPAAYWARLPFQGLFALLTWRGTST
jgi:uncharacterized membrane protein